VVDEQGVTFYDQGRGGIEHTLLCEEGWIQPGSVIAGGDSHTCTYGALGRFGTGLGSTDIAACLASGSSGRRCLDDPGGVHGRQAAFVTGKDLILAVIGEIGVGGATNAVLEFVGEGARRCRWTSGLAVSNMASSRRETGLFPPDDTTRLSQ
jgi:3-isopropylmalate/(R)-2-methylmalate dehydratase large subunit